MNTQSVSRRTALIVVLLILFCTAVMSFVCSQKEQFHVDEIWSYAMANSHDMPYFFTWQPGINGDEEVKSYADFNPEDEETYKAYFYHWKDSTFYHDYVTVQPGQQFDYGNTYHNQELDNHPPLFLFILHTICSFFPDRFSKWFGMVPNLVFYALSMLVLFLISKALGNSDQQAVLTMLLWGLSRAGIYTVIYIRMYMLLALLTLCITYLHILLLKDFRVKYVALIVIVDILGCLTQYYYYIFAFFITAFTCLILLYRKKFRQLFGIGFSALGAVVIGIAAFPAVIRQVTHGAWTESTFDNMVNGQGSAELFLKFIFDHYSSFISLFFLAILLIYGIDIIKKIFSKEDPSLNSDPTSEGQMEILKKKFGDIYVPLFDYLKKGNALIIASAVCTGVLICKLSPRSMGNYQDRYIFAVFPLLAVIYTDAIILIINKIAGFFSKKLSLKQVCGIAGVLILILVTQNNLSANNIYLKNNSAAEKDPDLNKLIAGRQVILVNGDDVAHIYAYTLAFRNAYMVCPADRLGDDLAEVINNYEGSEPLMLIVDGFNGSSYDIEEFLRENTSCEFQYLTTTHYSLTHGAALHVFELMPQN